MISVKYQYKVKDGDNGAEVGKETNEKGREQWSDLSFPFFQCEEQP